MGLKMYTKLSKQNASDVDCKQNEAMCSKKHNPKYKQSHKALDIF